MKTSVGESAYPEQGSVYNLGQLLARNAGQSGFSDRIAVIDAGRKDCRGISYRTLNERAARCANALSALGVKKGDRVFVLLPNRVETLEVLYGCFKIGAVFTPANFRFAAEEIAFLIDDMGASAVFFDTEYAETVREVLSERPQLRAVEIGGHSVKSAHAYEPCLAAAAATEPGCPTAPTDTCMISSPRGPRGVRRASSSRTAARSSPAFQTGSRRR